MVMTHVSEILDFNKKFVEEKEYESYLTSRFPDKKCWLSPVWIRAW